MFTGEQVTGGQIATTIFKLRFENAANLLPILRPLINPNNTINVNPGNNSLVITDYADNLTRLGRIIAALDVANATDVELIALKHVSVADIAPLIIRLIDGGASSVGGAAAVAETGYKTTVLAEPKSNSLIVRAANSAKMAQIKSLAQSLDKPSLIGPNGAAGNIYVVYLKNAEAVKLASVLRAALAATASSGPTASVVPVATAAGTGMAVTPSASPTTGGFIQADPATNSLIITASEPQYRQIRAVIDQLDGRRAQVYVESLIAEVNMDKAAEFGIQWQGPLGGKGDALIGLLGTNFGSANKNILPLSMQRGAGVLPSPGLNLGVAAPTKFKVSNSPRFGAWACVTG